MSKISEQKALEAYPPHYQKLAGDGYFDMSLEKREGYIRGYDQAFQDFVEKAEKILTERMYFSDDEAKEFKNYMKNESKK